MVSFASIGTGPEGWLTYSWKSLPKCRSLSRSTGRAAECGVKNVGYEIGQSGMSLVLLVYQMQTFREDTISAI